MNTLRSVLTCCALFLFLLYQNGECATDHRDTIIFAFAQWKPVVYLDENNNPKGIYPEILHELFEKKLGYRVQYEDYPWKRCQYNLESGTVDFAIMLPTEERLSYSDKSDLPIYSFYLHVFTYKDHPKIDNIRTIKSAADILRLDLTPATNLGNGWHKKNIDNHGVKTSYVRREIEVFKFLADKRADIVIDVLSPSLYLIKKMGLENKIVVTPARFGPVNLHLMVSKRSAQAGLMPAINRALEELKQAGVLERITSKYEHIH